VVDSGEALPSLPCAENAVALMIAAGARSGRALRSQSAASGAFRLAAKVHRQAILARFRTKDAGRLDQIGIVGLRFFTCRQRACGSLEHLGQAGEYVAEQTGDPQGDINAGAVQH